MKTIFNLNNPIWKFVGNLADFALLTILWALFSLPIVTIGASTSALYYTTLKMASNQEGYTAASFWNSFKENLKKGTQLWLILLSVAVILIIDCYWSLAIGTTWSLGLLIPFGILLIAVMFTARFAFVLLARCENTLKNLLSMSVSISLRNFLPILSTILVSVGFYLVGIFIFWPLLIVGPGLCAYLNSFIFNRILNKYGFALIDH